MFLSLVRPDRISSPMTRRPAVTCPGAALVSCIGAGLEPMGETDNLPSRRMVYQGDDERREAEPMSARQQTLREQGGKPPFRPIAFAPPDIACERRADGSVLLRSATPLAPYDPSLGRMFRAAVAAQPARVF